MNHSTPVRVIERAGHLAGDSNRLLDRQPSETGHPLPQCLSVDGWHHEEQETVGTPRVEQWQNVRVAETRRRSNLGLEAFDADGRPNLRSQYFDGDAAVVAEVVGEVHVRHAAVAEHTLEAIVVGERRGEGFGP